MGRKKENRVRIHRTVRPSTIKLIKKLAEAMDVSEGKVIDWAVEAAAVSTSFGPQALRVQRESKQP